MSKSMISNVNCGTRWREAANEFGFQPTISVGKGKYIR